MGTLGRERVLTFVLSSTCMIRYVDGERGIFIAILISDATDDTYVPFRA